MLLNEPSRCAFKQRPSRWDELSVTAWEGVGMFWRGGAVPVFSIDCRGSQDGQRAEGGTNWVWKGPSEGTRSNPRGGFVPHMAPGPYAGLGLCPTWNWIQPQGWVCAPNGTEFDSREGFVPHMAPDLTPGVGLCPTWHRIHMQVWVCAPHGNGSDPRAGFVPPMAPGPYAGLGLCPTWHRIQPRAGFVPHMALDPTPGLGLCPPWHWI